MISQLLKLKKTSLLLFVVVILLFVWLVIRFIFGGPEDSWICVSSQWQAHGYPASPPPSTPCL